MSKIMVSFGSHVATLFCGFFFGILVGMTLEVGTMLDLDLVKTD